MTFEGLLESVPELEPYVRHMPERIRLNHTILTLPPKHTIHRKGSELRSFGIVCRGVHRVVNEFENGNVFMIERNEAISFIGEVTLLAEQARTSVMIETVTECLILFISLEDFHYWVERDIHFLRLLAGEVARKLYRSSSDRGARLFYSANYMLLKYLIDYAREEKIEERQSILVKKTRVQIYEETGMTVKTLNRTIARLRADGLVSIVRGKMSMNADQYRNAIDRAGIYLRQNRRGRLEE